MIDENELIDILKKKAEYYCKFKEPVHISLKANKWLNGTIEEYSADYFILNEFKEGKKPVFFIEILPNGIEPFKRDEK